jgi:hypothetical protein
MDFPYKLLIEVSRKFPEKTEITINIAIIIKARVLRFIN